MKTTPQGPLGRCFYEPIQLHFLGEHNDVLGFNLKIVYNIKLIHIDLPMSSERS